MSEEEIVILDAEYENPGDLSWDELNKLGNLTIYDDTDHNDEELILSRIEKATIVLTNKVPITKRLMEEASNLKFISVLATGVNVIDLNEADRQGIFVSNVPDYSTDSVAQLTFAHLLEITNRVGHHSRVVRNGKWSELGTWTFYDYPLIELSGKTLGIIGFGAIGQKVGSIAKNFGMNVIAYNRSTSESGEKIANYVEKEELFQQADIISLHIPLSDDTKEIIDKGTINSMKDGVIIINTSRGPLLNERDVAEALNNDKIYALGVDVTSNEPIEKSNPLLRSKNTFITPHIAWATKESRERLIELTITNIQKFLKGTPVHIVNEPN